ncbi:MAG: response regulator [Candidatus Competibacter phosphatis]|nr:response regulator [Candidatus Competibacter sp.]
MRRADYKPIPKPTFLIAHGEEVMRRRFKDTLKAAGYGRVVAVENGRLALGELQLGYNLLITALDLPGLDGWRLLRMIRSGAFCSSRLPVLVVCDAHLVSVAEPMARDCHANLLAENDLAQLPDAVVSCLDGPKKPTVLVVEDNPDTARLIELSLRDCFDVQVALTGQEGLAAWQTQQHELILLDLMLPDLNGLEILLHVVAAKATQLVVVITARSEQVIHRELMEAGATAFLSKPINSDLLSIFCERILRQYGTYRHQRTDLERRQESERFIHERILAAHHLLTTGRAGMATQQLRQAIAAQETPLGDDEWATLLAEFAPEHRNVVGGD